MKQTRTRWLLLGLAIALLPSLAAQAQTTIFEENFTGGAFDKAGWDTTNSDETWVISDIYDPTTQSLSFPCSFFVGPKHPSQPTAIPNADGFYLKTNNSVLGSCPSPIITNEYEGNDDTAFAELPALNTSGFTGVEVSFYVTGEGSATDGITLQFKTDASDPWTTTSISIVNGLTGSWAQQSVANTSFDNQSNLFLRVMFEEKGTGATAPAFGVDNIVVQGTPSGITWEGDVDSAWATPGNWSGGSVPNGNDNVIIPTSPIGNRMPKIMNGTAAMAQALTIESGATLNQMMGGTLEITDGALTNDGSYMAMGGNLTFSGSSGQQTIDGSGTNSFYRLTVTNTNGLMANNDLTVKDELDISGTSANFMLGSNTLTLMGNSTQTAMVAQGSNDVSGGTVVMERMVTSNAALGNVNGRGYRYFASPFAGATVGNFFQDDMAEFTLNNPYSPANGGSGNATSPFPTVYFYDEALISGSNPDIMTGWESPGGPGMMMNPGQGFIANISAGTKVDVSGTTLNNGSLSRAVTDGGMANSGFNLLGNPYPAPISWDALHAANSGLLNGTIYFRNATSQFGGDFVEYVAGGVSNPLGVSDGTIQTMQGFFVEASGDGNVSFTNSQRLNSQPTNLTFFKGNEDQPEKDALVSLSLEHQDVSDNLVVYFDEQATAGYDRNQDAELMMLNSLPKPSMYSMVEDRKLAINGLTLQGGEQTVPLGFYIPENGQYTLHANELIDNTPAGMEVYLQDSQTGERQLLRKGTQHQFQGQKGFLEGRFVLRFKPAVVTGQASKLQEQNFQLFPNPNQGQFEIVLEGDNQGAHNLQVTSLTGQEVFSTSFTKGQYRLQRSIELDAPAGIYLVTLRSEQKTWTQKVVVE